MALEEEELTGRTLGLCFDVANEVGTGMYGSVYKKSLSIAVAQAGLAFGVEVPFRVLFCGHDVGKF